MFCAAREVAVRHDCFFWVGGIAEDDAVSATGLFSDVSTGDTTDPAENDAHYRSINQLHLVRSVPFLSNNIISERRNLRD